MGNPVVHFEIAANDGKKMQEFYAKLFDWKVDANNPMNYGMVETQGNSGINGGIFTRSKSWQPPITFYVHVDDLQKYLDRAIQLGGRQILPPTLIAPEIGSCAMFEDPDGNVIGLFK